MRVSVLVPYWGRDVQRVRNVSWVRRRWSELAPSGTDLLVGPSDVRVEGFPAAAVRNRLFEQSRGEVVVFADADVFLRTPWEEVLNAIDAMDGWAIPYARYWNLDRVASQLVCAEPAETHVEAREVAGHVLQDVPSVAGMQICRRECVIPWDEEFQGWGYEDNAFVVGMTSLWGRPYRPETGTIFHLWHPIKAGEHFDNPDIAANRRLMIEYLRRADTPDDIRRWVRRNHPAP